MPAEALSYYFRYTAQQAPGYFGEWDYTSALDRVKAPTLVVYGANDSLAVPMQKSWAAAFPNGRLLLVPGAGKAALSEKPAFAIAEIDSFLQGTWPAAAHAVE